MRITQSVRLKAGTYLLPDGISIGADHISVAGDGVHLVGPGGAGTGIMLRNRRGVTVRGLHLSHYYTGVRAERCTGLNLQALSVRATSHVPSDTIALDIWTPLNAAYSTALLLVNCAHSSLCNNDVQHNMNGISLYDCRAITVARNRAHYAAGFGIHLNGTSNSVFEDNGADFCCRYAVQKPGHGLARDGMIGAYAVGFLIVNGSNRNVLRRNHARMCGDSFFLCALERNAGRRADGNVFEENDGSGTPGIAFEATFSRGTVFRNNLANYSKYGFWLGYSWDALLEGNRALGNRLAGIAVENGRHSVIRANDLQVNGHGILLWSDWSHTQFEKTGPGATTSSDWLIEGNMLIRNTTAIRIAAEQDQGTEPLPHSKRSLRRRRPHHHAILNNTIQNNRLGIDLFSCDHTPVHGNTFHGNVEGNVRQENCTETRIAGNPGFAGAYL